MWILLVALRSRFGVFGCQTDANHERQALKTRSAPPSSAGGVGAHACAGVRLGDSALLWTHGRGAERATASFRVSRSCIQLTGFVRRRDRRSRAQSGRGKVCPSIMNGMSGRISDRKDIP